MSIFLIMFAIGVVVMSTMLVLSSKLTGVGLPFTSALIVAAVSSVLAMFSGIFGWLFSLLAMYFLLKKMTGAPTFPSLILMIIISKLLTVMAGMVAMVAMAVAASYIYNAT